MYECVTTERTHENANSVNLKSIRKVVTFNYIFWLTTRGRYTRVCTTILHANEFTQRCFSWTEEMV